jgi:hypothetical protein
MKKLIGILAMGAAFVLPLSAVAETYHYINIHGVVQDVNAAMLSRQ